jgi:hypothetical protein
MFSRLTRPRRTKRRKDKAGRDNTSVGNILVDLGYCDRKTVFNTVRIQIESMPRIGELLVDQAVITPEQLDHALMRQQVLRGLKEPDSLKRYGMEDRKRAIAEAARRLRIIADSALVLAKKAPR